MSEQYYCARPFQWFSLLDNGNVAPCCPPWVNGYTYGNLKESSMEEVWNSEKAQEFRRSILDGSFKYCNEKSCPLLQLKIGEVSTLEKMKQENPIVYHDIKNQKTKLDHGPRIINCDYDRSCNLSCPSCRRHLIMLSGKKREEALQLQDKLIDEGFTDMAKLTVTASGDAFASPIFRKLLQNLKKENAPNLDHITILTNGLLIKKYWDTLSDFVKQKTNIISVSIDAASAETYHINRRGGNWDDLQENLAFIQNIRESGQIYEFKISMVVQENNFHEIKDFVKMGELYHVDGLVLKIIEPDFIRDLGQKDFFAEWEYKAIQEKTHPRHEELCQIIKDPFFSKYIERYKNATGASSRLDMGPLYDLRFDKDISQYDKNLEEYLTIKENENKKDIWFDGKVYYVEFENLKTINGTDVARIDTGDIVAWKGSDWEKCSEGDEIATKFMELQNES